MVALSERQLWRLRGAFERDGPAGLVHGNHGRPSGRRLNAALRERVVELRRTTYGDVNETHLAELLAEREEIEISRPSLQRILRAAGLASPEGVARRATAAGVSGWRPRASSSSSTAATTTRSRRGVRGWPSSARSTTPRAWSRRPPSRDQEDAAAYLENLRVTNVGHGLPGELYHDRHTPSP